MEGNLEGEGVHHRNQMGVLQSVDVHAPDPLEALSSSRSGALVSCCMGGRSWSEASSETGNQFNDGPKHDICTRPVESDDANIDSDDEDIESDDASNEPDPDIKEPVSDKVLRSSSSE